MLIEKLKSVEKIMDIRSKVIEIIADQAIIETSDVSDESTLEGLGIDSLG